MLLAVELLDMPLEMQLAILVRCTPCDVMRISRVCRHLNQLIEIHIARLPKREVDVYIKHDTLHWRMVIAINDWYDTVEEAMFESQRCLLSNCKTNSLDLTIERERVQEDDLTLVRTVRSVNVPSQLFNDMRRTLRHVHVNTLWVAFIDEVNMPGMLRFLHDCYCEMRWQSFEISFLYCDFTYIVYDDWIAFLRATRSHDSHFFRKFEITESRLTSVEFLLPALRKCEILHRTFCVKGINEIKCRDKNFKQSDNSQIYAIIKNVMLAHDSLCNEFAISFACCPLVATDIIDLIESWKNSNQNRAAGSSRSCKFQISWQDYIEDDTKYGEEFSRVRIHFNSRTDYILIEKHRNTSELLVFFSDKSRCALYIFYIPKQHDKQLDEPVDVWIRDYIIDDYINQAFDMNDIDDMYGDVIEVEDELKALLNRFALRSRLCALGIMTKEDEKISELLELQDDLQTLDDELGL